MSRYASTRPFLGSLAAAAAIALLAGCGGAQTQPNLQTPSQAGAAIGAHAAATEPDSCPSQGGVRATPCKVVLTPSNPGPVSVTLRTPHGAKGSVVEHDTCGSAGIATIAQGSGDTWTVTAGQSAGSCKVRFNYFNNAQKVGYARVKVKNSI